MKILAVLVGLMSAWVIQPALALEPGAGVEGTFVCSCTHGNGTCNYQANKKGSSCYGGGSATCTGECELITTTTGAAPTRERPPEGEGTKPVVPPARMAPTNKPTNK